MPLRGVRIEIWPAYITHTSSMKTSAIFSGLEGKVYTKMNKVLVLSNASIFSVHLSGQEV